MKNKIRFFLSFISALLLSHCSLSIVTPAASNIEWINYDIQLGNLVSGNTLTKTIQIKNLGPDIITSYALRTSYSYFTYSNIDCPTTISVGTSCNLQITLSFPQGGDYDSNLYLDQTTKSRISSSTLLGVLHFSIQSTWMWLGGTNQSTAIPSWGTLNTPSNSNFPGGRIVPGRWVNSNGDLMMFGGETCYTRTGTTCTSTAYANDLWKYSLSANQWTWIGGPQTANDPGNFGSKGVESSTNLPPAGYAFGSAYDSQGNGYVFGGGIIAGGMSNALWKFTESTQKWTWISGSSSANSAGVFGSQGVLNPSNEPPALFGPVLFFVGNTLYLFGGYDSSWASRDNLWKYENDQWAYVSGHTTATNTGVYGTQGVAAGGNQIGSRFTPAIWVKGTDIYVFGGAGIDSAGAAGELNDLWKFDGTNWTWLGGSQTKDPAGNYTAFNTFSSVALPSGRHGSTYYVDPNNPTLFHVVGGKGIDPQGVGGATTYYLNDHWVYNSDTNQWKWIGGNNQINPAGSFGSSGVIQASNLMSGREGSANWIVNKFLYVFAGFGVDSAGNTPRPSDFWRYSN